MIDWVAYGVIGFFFFFALSSFSSRNCSCRKSDEALDKIIGLVGELRRYTALYWELHSKVDKIRSDLRKRENPDE